jgi:hypothetical protein
MPAFAGMTGKSAANWQQIVGGFKGSGFKELKA